MKALQYCGLGVFKRKMRKQRKAAFPRIMMMMDQLQANFAGVIPA
jgi:hypothetical protein